MYNKIILPIKVMQRAELVILLFLGGRSLRCLLPECAVVKYCDSDRYVKQLIIIVVLFISLYHYISSFKHLFYLPTTYYNFYRATAP